MEENRQNFDLLLNPRKCLVNQLRNSIDGGV